MGADWSALASEQEIWVQVGADGEASASLALDVRPDHVLIWSVAVTPAAQHAGLGRRLLAFAEVRCRELGRTELRLYTNALMERNVALYARLGYAEVRREPLADRVLVHMTKRLR